MPALRRPYLFVYAVTLFCSAFLLFLVQPLFSKMILPLLGGSPSVWNTAMLFFQVMLLAGYAYAHAVAQFLSIRVQAILHAGLLFLFIVVLPLGIPDGWTPPDTGNPSFWQLGLMACTVGGPFFVLSGCAPLLQHWFAHTGHKDSGNPYFLYAASNLGSMSALIAYPVLCEPLLSVPEQSFGWALGYGGLGVLIGCAYLCIPRLERSRKEDMKSAIPDDEKIGWRLRGTWLILAFVPSSLMLGVTTFITTDLASVPMLWVMPLALYVSTFIIAFARKPILQLKTTLVLQTVLMILLLFIEASMLTPGKYYLLILHILLFFFSALMCHQELAALRPPARHLTQFYLFMSLGGALGGFFNAILAPVFFIVPFEYGAALVLAAFMRFASRPENGLRAGINRLRRARESGLAPLLLVSGLVPAGVTLAVSIWTAGHADDPRLLISGALACFTVLMFMVRSRWVFGLCAAAILLVHLPGQNLYRFVLKDVQYQDRNFFGILRVGDATHEETRMMLHGTTIHGVQALAPAYRKEPLAYYSRESSLGQVFSVLDEEKGPQKIAALGLGVGAVSCYFRDHRRFDFFEIDPAVISVAENPALFTYLRDCGGEAYRIIQGDGRLRIAEQPDGTYDAIFLDVFSSDNIPVHVMTLEAFALYKKKLNPDGIIIVNISNRFMYLRPVVAAAAADLGLTAWFRYAKGGILSDSGLPYLASQYMVLTANPVYGNALDAKGWNKIEADGRRVWTDQYSDIISVLKIFQ